MIERYESNGIVWINLEAPTKDDVRTVVDEFNISPSLADELLIPSLKPYAQRADKELYLALHFPVMHKAHVTGEQEVDFIIGHSFVLTNHYEKMPVLEKFKKVFTMNQSLEKNNFNGSPLNIFIAIAKQLYTAVEEQIDEVHDTLEDIERDIFAGKEREMVEALSYAGRNILNLKQSLDPHQDVLRTLSLEVGNFAGSTFRNRLRAIDDIYYRERKHITRLWQTISELRETNNSLLSTKQNEIMQIFTILAFVTFPLSLFASIFGMNTAHIPIVGRDYDFWIVIGAMAFATFLMFLFFKHKKWL